AQRPFNLRSARRLCLAIYELCAGRRFPLKGKQKTNATKWKVKKMAKPKKKKMAGPQFKFEYVTSTVSLLVIGNQGDGIVVHVLNDSAVSENARAIIYQNTGAGAIVAVDSGSAVVAPSWQWGLGFTIQESGEY